MHPSFTSLLTTIFIILSTWLYNDWPCILGIFVYHISGLNVRLLASKKFWVEIFWSMKKYLKGGGHAKFWCWFLPMDSLGDA